MMPQRNRLCSVSLFSICSCGASRFLGLFGCVTVFLALTPDGIVHRMHAVIVLTIRPDPPGMVAFERWLHRYFPHETGNQVVYAQKERSWGPQLLRHTTYRSRMEEVFGDAVRAAEGIDAAYPEDVLDELVLDAIHRDSKTARWVERVSRLDYSLEDGCFRYD